MWVIGGHEILITGVGYDEDWWGSRYTVRCVACPDGTQDTPVWAAEEDREPYIDYDEALTAVTTHVRDHDAISQGTLRAAIFLAALTRDMEAGLTLLGEPPTTPET